MSNLKVKLRNLERNNPVANDEGQPKGTQILGQEYIHSNPEICRSLPKRGFAGIKMHIIMFNPADEIEVFTGKSNMKLIKCGWCNHLARDCNGASYLQFDLPSIRKTMNIQEPVKINVNRI